MWCVLGFICCFLNAAWVTGQEQAEPVPGLVATFRDDVRAVTAVVSLAELGLGAKESPHPAIKPAFSAEWSGKLRIKQPGKYRFDFPGKVMISGVVVKGEAELTAGYHDLVLSYQREAGEVSVGFYWESGHFIKEPVPPGVLWHRMMPVTQDKVKGDNPSPPFRIARTMKEMKCASCHDSDFLTTMHHKFAPDALMLHIRHANTMKWYGAMTGPHFKKDERLEQLVKDLQKLPQSQRRHQPGKAEAKGMKMVGSKAGLACIACHDIRHHRTAAESKGPNLTYLGKRVSYDWFVRWMNNPQRLKPGVPMPAFFAGQKAEERQANIDALWDYLLQGEKMPLPEELEADPEQFILKPKGQPLVNRVYIRLPDKRELLRAICVGLPNGMSYCFDAETCQLVYVWTGGYLDMAPHWENQSGFPTPPVGESFHLAGKSEGLRIGKTSPVYRGYQLVDGIPQFEFVFGDTAVKMRVDSSASGLLRQIYQIDAREDAITFARPAEGAPVSVKASLGKWSGNTLVLEDKGAVTLELTYSKGDKQ